MRFLVPFLIDYLGKIFAYSFFAQDVPRIPIRNGETGFFKRNIRGKPRLLLKGFLPQFPQMSGKQNTYDGLSKDLTR